MIMLDSDFMISKDKPYSYSFNEDEWIINVQKYIDMTYTAHYGNGQYQATDMIIDAGHGEGFCIGNIMKYAMRYGKKDGKKKSELLKIIHYAIIALYLNEKADG
jgi:hypothetical protein